MGTSPGATSSERMMKLKALLEVQLILLHPLPDRAHFLLHKGDGLLHIVHPSLESTQCLHNPRIIDLRLGWRDSLGGGSHIWKANMHSSRYGLLIIGIISPQLSI
jgi:hypothetical protein